MTATLLANDVVEHLDTSGKMVKVFSFVWFESAMIWFGFTIQLTNQGGVCSFIGKSG